MKETLFVLQTVNDQFVSFDQEGDKHLKTLEVEEYYNADKFDTEDEVNAFLELLNTGKTSNPHIRQDWKITIDHTLLPVKKRIMVSELVDEHVEITKEKV